MKRGLKDYIEDILKALNNVDLIIVWDTIKKDLPTLKPVIQGILKNLEE